MEKLRYEVDPHNRLVIKKSGQQAELPRFRRVLDGNFRVDGKNNLAYHIKAPFPEEIKAPYQVKLKGSWSLTENHDLRFTLDKWRRQTFGDELTLQGEIIDVEANSLIFLVTTRTKQGHPSAYILRLAGSWQADKRNRLTFAVKREEEKNDILCFDGIWQIGKDYQVIYRYEKAQLTRKQKKIHTLVFQGFWDIRDKARIAYLMERSTDSLFNFKTSFGIFKDNSIKYELGIGLSHRRKPLKRTIILFGTWKIKENVGLIFQVESEKRKIYNIVFGAEARLTDKDTLLFKLKNELNKEIGGELELAHKILAGDGQAFLRLLRLKRESTILVGGGFRW